MSRSKSGDNGENSKPLKDDHLKWESEGEEDDYGHRKKKKSGKRFHRKMTIREKYWDGLSDID
ncbi:hypothetical protein ACFL2O_10030 [Thermodesulfobacteriota bacterium]